MVVFSHRTFRWSLTRRMMLWVLGGVVGFWALAMIGSGYGLWATKKIMSFSNLQKETLGAAGTTAFVTRPGPGP